MKRKGKGKRRRRTISGRPKGAVISCPSCGKTKDDVDIVAIGVMSGTDGQNRAKKVGEFNLCIVCVRKDARGTKNHVFQAEISPTYLANVLKDYEG